MAYDSYEEMSADKLDEIASFLRSDAQEVCEKWLKEKKVVE